MFFLNRFYRFFVSSIFLSLPFTLCFGQSSEILKLSGEILDSSNSKPIPFANVLIRDASDSTILKTGLSNDTGGFSITSPKLNVYIEVRALGFKRKIKEISTLDKSDNLKIGSIFLETSSINLKEVTIEGDKPLFENQAGKLIINLSENALGNNMSMIALLNQLPGVQVTPDEQILYNGRGIRIFIDGKASPLSVEALKGLLRTTSSNNYQKIEIISNPSAKYDADGAGGIINLVKKRNINEGITGNIYTGLEYGAYGRPRGGLILNYKNRNYNIYFNTEYGYTKYFLDTDISSELFGEDSFESHSNIRSIRRNHSYSPSLGIDLYLSEKSTLSLSGSHNYQNFNKNASNQTYFTDSEIFDQFSLNNDNKSQTKMYTANAFFQQKIDSVGEMLTIDFNLQNNLVNSELYSQDLREFKGSNNNSNFMLHQRDNLAFYSLNIDYTKPISNKGAIELGSKSSYAISKNRNTFSEPPEQQGYYPNFENNKFTFKENINALYFSVNQQFKKFSYEAGVRGEYTINRSKTLRDSLLKERDFFNIFPTVSLQYKLTEKDILKLVANNRISRPNYENLNPLLKVISSNTYTQGNPYVNSERSYYLSSSYSRNNEIFFTVDYTYMKGAFFYAVLDYNDFYTTTTPLNSDYLKYLNFSITFNKQLTKWWFQSSNIDIWKRKSKWSLEDQEFFSDGSPTFNFSTFHSFNVSKDLSFMFLLRYYGKLEENNKTTLSNFVMAAGINRKILNGRGTIGLNMYDIIGSYRNKFIQKSVNINQSWENYYDLKHLVRASFSYSIGKGKIKDVNKGKGSEEESNRSKIEEK